MPPKNTSPYDVVRPEGCPEWFEPGILCRVWDNGNTEQQSLERRVLGYRGGESPWLALGTNSMTVISWNHASPIERWKPKPGEWVAKLIDAEKIGHWYIYPYIADTQNGGLLFRLDYPDGRIIDLRGSIDDIKKRTDWV